MHRILACGVGVFVAFASVGSASAADISRPAYKAAPYYSPAPVFSWTGFYIGAHGGYGWSRFSGDAGFGPESVTGRGWLGGGQIGYNYQINQFVIGAEIDAAWADVKREEPFLAGSVRLKNDYFITATARIGYAFDRTLVYGKIGAAWTRDKWDASDGLGGTATASNNRTGWAFGAGVEYALWSNWSAKLEYNYLMFRGVTPTFTTGGGLAVVGTASIELDTQIVKAGLNYRF
ncbi:MAG: porin family protein [Pseudolabrys sp.]|nr:porin family protein [Pseudolabrys sp.]